jgi:putative transposase
MKIQRAYKVEIKPNNKQKTLLNKSFGVARFAFNWALDRKIKAYKKDKTNLSAYDLIKELTALKKTEFPWMYEVSKSALQISILDLQEAYKNFFRRLKNKEKNVGFPKFKSKRNNKDSFRYIDGSSKGWYITNSQINIPKVGHVRLKEKGYIPVNDPNVKYNSVTVSKENNKYYVSVQCEVEIQEPNKEIEEVIGVDLGIKTLATVSNGQTFENPKVLKKHQKKLKRLQRRVSKKKQGSKNRRKAINKLSKLHGKIKNIRKDNLHKMTTVLVKTKRRVIVIEDLNVEGMVKNHHLANAVSDASFYEAKRQLEYKTSWYGGVVFKVDRWFPSSKLCSSCGVIKEDLKLSQRTYNCECGLSLDRDLNAAINLRNYYLNKQNTDGLSGIDACGEEKLQDKGKLKSGAPRRNKKRTLTRKVR